MRKLSRRHWQARAEPGRPRPVKRTLWARRAQNTKPRSIGESSRSPSVRDLYRRNRSRTTTRRQLYEAALTRSLRNAVCSVGNRGREGIEGQPQRAPRRGSRKTEAGTKVRDADAMVKTRVGRGGVQLWAELKSPGRETGLFVGIVIPGSGRFARGKPNPEMSDRDPGSLRPV